MNMSENVGRLGDVTSHGSSETVQGSNVLPNDNNNFFWSKEGHDVISHAIGAF